MSIRTSHIKYQFSVLLIFWQIVSFAQIPMEKVLAEMGTATWNAACATEVQMIDQMKADGYVIAVINYHLNDPFANQYANQRASYYGIQNLPYPVIGGQAAQAGDYSSYTNLYNASINTPSSFSLTAVGHFSEDTLILNINIHKVADYEGESLLFYAAVTESDIPFDWQGLSHVEEVERSMTPDGNGQQLDFTGITNIALTEKILFEGDWNPENMELVTFLQDGVNKNILQCHSELLTQFSPLPVHAFFQVADTLVCADEIVSFENVSTGDVDNVSWLFTGGNPSQSNEYSPHITYASEGSYAVSLIVSNSVSCDTLNIANYIDVNPLPNMSFAPLPDFCQYVDYYQLMEGAPEGGNYFGLFVDTGYFHPQTAGLGYHTIYYAYQEEEYGCSDTLTQDAYVYFCEDIEELSSNLSEFPFVISQNNGQVFLTKKNISQFDIKSLEIFNIEGQLLYQYDSWKKNENTISFLYHLNNPLLLFHVHTSKRTYIFKYQIMN